MAVMTRIGTARTRRTGPVLAAVTLGFAVIQLDVSVVNVAVRALATGLGAGVSGVQWVVDGYTLTFAALILSAGALGDRIGARRMLLAGFGVFIAASAACGASGSIVMLVAARLVQGAGAAALGACSLALLSHTFPDPGERARAVGIWAAGGSAALASGPLAGGVLIALFGWRAIFFINVPLGLAGCWLLGRYAAETPLTKDRAMDLRGQGLAVAALVALAWSTITAGARGFGSWPVLAGYAVAGAAMAAFVALERRRERRRERPMVPLRLLRSRALCIGFVINSVFYGLIFAFSLFLQRRDGLSALATGLAFLPVMLAIVATNVLGGRLPGGRAVVSGSVLMGTGCLMVLASLALPVLIAGLSVTGLGIGLIAPAITSSLLGSVARSRSGVASGALTAFRQTGSMLGVALSGTLLAAHGLVWGIRLACVLSAGLLLGVTLTAWGSRG
jgi:DHA2 family methylenomycin A resistance protein-like MFS transporter